MVAKAEPRRMDLSELTMLPAQTLWLALRAYTLAAETLADAAVAWRGGPGRRQC